MSSLRIALIAEGKTDKVVIGAALESILGHSNFVLIQLQPDEGSEALGGVLGVSARRGEGWGGVYRWCRGVDLIGAGSLDAAGLDAYDLIIIHVDADVAQCTYQAANITDNMHTDLPCAQPCPPAAATIRSLTSVVQGWLPTMVGNGKILTCIPSLCTEAWVVAALYAHDDDAIQHNLECNTSLIGYMCSRPGKRLISMHGRVTQKRRQRYLDRQDDIALNWDIVEHYCPGAMLFSENVKRALSQ